MACTASVCRCHMCGSVGKGDRAAMIQRAREAVEAERIRTAERAAARELQKPATEGYRA